MTIAERGQWKTKPMPRQRSKIPCNRLYRRGEMDQMMRGLIPEQMEDKWFIFWERNTLHFHRSWTGYCVFRAKFRPVQDGWKLYEIVANRNEEQYHSSDVHDAKEVPFLIDVLLLRKNVEREDDSPEATVALWGQIGRALLGDHPGRQRES